MGIEQSIYSQTILAV